MTGEKSFSEAVASVVERAPQEIDVLRDEEPHLEVRVHSMVDVAFWSPWRRFGFKTYSVDHNCDEAVFIVKGIYSQ